MPLLIFAGNALEPRHGVAAVCLVRFPLSRNGLVIGPMVGLVVPSVGHPTPLIDAF